MKRLAAAALLASTALAPAASADEVTYTKHIRPLVAARCGACHGSDSPDYGDFMANEKQHAEAGRGPRLDGYAELVLFVAYPDTGALMRRLDDGKGRKDGKPGNMYENLGDDEAERQKNLALVKAWVGSWNLKRWDEVTKKELDQLKLEY